MPSLSEQKPKSLQWPTRSSGTPSSLSDLTSSYSFLPCPVPTIPVPLLSFSLSSTPPGPCTSCFYMLQCHLLKEIILKTATSISVPTVFLVPFILLYFFLIVVIFLDTVCLCGGCFFIRIFFIASPTPNSRMQAPSGSGFLCCSLEFLVL